MASSSRSGPIWGRALRASTTCFASSNRAAVARSLLQHGPRGCAEARAPDRRTWPEHLAPRRRDLRHGVAPVRAPWLPSRLRPAARRRCVPVAPGGDGHCESGQRNDAVHVGPMPWRPFRADRTANPAITTIAGASRPATQAWSPPCPHLARRATGWPLPATLPTVVEVATAEADVVVVEGGGGNGAVVDGATVVVGGATAAMVSTRSTKAVGLPRAARSIHTPGDGRTTVAPYLPGSSIVSTMGPTTVPPACSASSCEDAGEAACPSPTNVMPRVEPAGERARGADRHDLDRAVITVRARRPLCSDGDRHDGHEQRARWRMHVS